MNQAHGLTVVHLRSLQYIADLQPYNIEFAYNKLKEVYSQKWDIERYSKQKLRYYNLYKADLSQEEYLNFDIPKYHRSIFAQFRAGILPLNVETGRFNSVPLEDRKCTLCDLDDVEDEFHLLIMCNKYNELRRHLYREAFARNNQFLSLYDLDKFVFLVNNLQKQVIKFIVSAILIRRDCIYTKKAT